LIELYGGQPNKFGDIFCPPIDVATGGGECHSTDVTGFAKKYRKESTIGQDFFCQSNFGKDSTRKVLAENVIKKVTEKSILVWTKKEAMNAKAEESKAASVVTFQESKAASVISSVVTFLHSAFMMRNSADVIEAPDSEFGESFSQVINPNYSQTYERLYQPFLLLVIVIVGLVYYLSLKFCSRPRLHLPSFLTTTKEEEIFVR